MNPVHVSPLIVVLALGGAVQLPFARPPDPETGVGSTAEGKSRSQAAVPDAEASIRAALRGVESAFSDGDLTRWLSHFHSTYVIMAPEGVIAPASENEALTVIRPQLEALRARGYARSDLNRVTVKLLSPATALASVEWIRRKADKAELERLGATYAFFKDENVWKIVFLTVHPSTTVVELK